MLKSINILSRKSFLLGIIFLLLANIGLAQDDSGEKHVTHQIWLDFNPSWKLSKRWDLNTKIGSKIIFPYEWHKFYTSVEGSYKIPKFMLKKVHYDEEVYFGVDFYYVYNTHLEDVIEISPYQGYSLKWPNSRSIIVKHDAELGERFQWGMKKGDHSFGLKLSYEASLTWKFHGDVWSYTKGFYLTCAVKLWWNLISTTVLNDVARLTPGIGYQINPKWKTAFLMGWNYTRNLTSEKFSTNNVIYRFRVYYKIPNKN